MAEYGNQVPAGDETPTLPSDVDWLAALRGRVIHEEPQEGSPGTAYGRAYEEPQK